MWVTPREPSEEDSNNLSCNTIGRDPTKDKYNESYIHPLHAGTRREYQEDM